MTCPPEHPLYVQGQGWVEAGSLGIGTSIVSRAGPAMQVTDLTWQKNKAQELAAGSSGSSFGGYTVYNLTVADDHTFFVGTTGGGIWVHNVCPINNALTRAEKDQLRAEARAIRQDETGRSAIWDHMEIHHRIPLEYSHLFPNAEPNRRANLQGVGFDDHRCYKRSLDWAEGYESVCC